MIPPTQQMQQAMMMQKVMGQGRPEDPLLQALSQHAMMGDMAREKAQHMIKMIKMRQKYMGQMQGQGQGQPPMGGGGS
jgi:hypothetical protein